MKFNKSQISVFEMIFAVVILLSSITYFGIYNTQKESGLHKIQVESFFDSIYYNEEYRNNFFNENLSQSTINGNWTNFSIILNSSFLNYGFKISNETTTKTIFSCSETLGKEVTEKIIAIKDNNYYEFRKLTLEVCY